MGAETIAALILQVGLPFTNYLIDLYHRGQTVTPDEWATLMKLANVSAKEEVTDRLKLAGVDPESDQGKRILGLLK